jgi:hypothetical protein
VYEFPKAIEAYAKAMRRYPKPNICLNPKLSLMREYEKEATAENKVLAAIATPMSVLVSTPIDFK